MRSPRLAARPSPFAKSITHVRPKSELPTVFDVGQKVVYPGYGVGQIQSIETKEIAGRKISFYMVRILETGVTVMVPVDKVQSVGLRPTASEKEIEQVYILLKKKEIVVELTTWNRRYREYMEKIKTGSIFEISEVVRDLCVIRQDKVLSFGEKKMLELAKGLLVKELAISEGSDEPTIESQVEEIYVKS